jgi:hypothetical protein
MPRRIGRRVLWEIKNLQVKKECYSIGCLFVMLFLEQIVGIVVELVLNFNDPMVPGFTEDEKTAIDIAKKQKEDQEEPK